jgi:glycosyltransferase involved in cell wall biosynthesis
LAQRDCDVEVVVVLDIPEHAGDVESMLDGLDYRLKTTNREGGAAARNVGVASATSQYVAFLDDDDCWLPDKSVKQIAALESATQTGASFAVGASRFNRLDGKQIPPRPLKRVSMRRLGDRLVERRHIRQGGTFFSTCALLAPRNLMIEFSWDERLPIHQDWDMFIRLADAGCEPLIVDGVVVEVWQGSSRSVSAVGNWSGSFIWYGLHAHDLSPRPRADFVWVHLLRVAILSRDVNQLRASLRLALNGVPHIAAVARTLVALVAGR